MHAHILHYVRQLESQAGCYSPKGRGLDEAAAFPGSSKRCSHLPLPSVATKLISAYTTQKFCTISGKAIYLQVLKERIKGQQDPKTLSNMYIRTGTDDTALTQFQNALLFTSRKSYILTDPPGFYAFSWNSRKMLLMKVFKVLFSYTYGFLPFPNFIFL